MGKRKKEPEMKERQNWLIHILYVRQDFEECLEVIEKLLAKTNGLCEYAIFVKGMHSCINQIHLTSNISALIMRHRGRIQESLQLFQTSTAINPQNIANLKQVGRSLYLLGKHQNSIEVYDEAQRLGTDDWEIWHNKGLCFLYLKQYEQAEECFVKANTFQRHDSTYMQLGKVYTHQEQYQEAIDVYLEALEYFEQQFNFIKFF